MQRKNTPAIIINFLLTIVLLAIPFINFSDYVQEVAAYASGMAQGNIVKLIAIGILINAVVSIVIAFNLLNVLCQLFLIDISSSKLYLLFIISKTIMATINLWIPSNLIVQYPAIVFVREFIFSLILIAVLYAYLAEFWQKNSDDIRQFIKLSIGIIVINSLLPVFNYLI